MLKEERGKNIVSHDCIKLYFLFIRISTFISYLSEYLPLFPIYPNIYLYFLFIRIFYTALFYFIFSIVSYIVLHIQNSISFSLSQIKSEYTFVQSMTIPLIQPIFNIYINIILRLFQNLLLIQPFLYLCSASLANTLSIHSNI